LKKEKINENIEGARSLKRQRNGASWGTEKNGQAEKIKRKGMGAMGEGKTKKKKITRKLCATQNERAQIKPGTSST